MLCALGAMDCASPRLREVEGSTLGGNKTLNFFVFRFPIFLNAFFTGICFFFYPECRLFQNRKRHSRSQLPTQVTTTTFAYEAPKNDDNVPGWTNGHNNKELAYV